MVSGNARDQLWVELERNEIRGSLTLEDNATDAIVAIGNVIDSDAQINRNYSRSASPSLPMNSGAPRRADNEVEMSANSNLAEEGVFGQCVELP